MEEKATEKQVIVVEVATPKGMFTAELPKTTKVKEVIDEIIKEQGLETSDLLELVFNGKVLQPVDRPLVSFGLEGMVQLELVATGSGA